jgi:hypothetical protein
MFFKIISLNISKLTPDFLIFQPEHYFVFLLSSLSSWVCIIPAQNPEPSFRVRERKEHE